MVDDLSDESDSKRAESLGGIAFGFDASLPSRIAYKIRLKPDQFGSEDRYTYGATSAWFTGSQFDQNPSVGPRENETSTGGSPGNGRERPEMFEAVILNEMRQRQRCLQGFWRKKLLRFESVKKSKRLQQHNYNNKSNLETASNTLNKHSTQF